MGSLERILLVDPGAHNREVLERVAASLGATLTTAADGEAALQAFTQSPPPNLLVLASQVGRLAAPELIAILRGKVPPGRMLPVILLVENEDAGKRFASFASGADDYVRSPIDEGEIAPRLRVFSRVLDLERQVFQAREEMERLITLDDVTGTFGRRFIHTQVRLEWTRAERYGEALSLALLDLPTLRDQRAHHGDAFAEAVLKETATRLAGSLRRCDLVSHVAWSQFLIVMPNTSTVGAYFAAEKMRAMVAARPFEHGAESEGLPVVLGVSTFQDGNFAGPEPLIDSVEEALRQALAKGPGSVVLFHPVAAT